MSCPLRLVFLHLSVGFILYIFLGLVYLYTDDQIIVVKTLGTLFSIWFIYTEIFSDKPTQKICAILNKTTSQQNQTEIQWSPMRQQIRCAPIPRPILLSRPSRPRFYRAPNNPNTPNVPSPWILSCSSLCKFGGGDCAIFKCEEFLSIFAVLVRGFDPISGNLCTYWLIIHSLKCSIFSEPHE